MEQNNIKISVLNEAQTGKYLYNENCCKILHRVNDSGKVQRVHPFERCCPVYWPICLQSGRLRRTLMVCEIIGYVWDDGF